MDINEKELLEYITSTIIDNLHYDNLIDTANCFGDEIDITTSNGKSFAIGISVEDTTDDEALKGEE